MLSTRHLQYNYPQGPAFSFPDIECGKGEHLLILGESGRGKTTLLHLLAGMLKSTGGSIMIGNENISAMSDRTLDKYRGKNVGIVFQTAHFVESLSVMDNLLLASFLAGKRQDGEKALSALRRLNLEQKAGQKPGQLSVGEQQRAAIARAIMNDPTVILADEPTSALDDNNAAEVITLLEEQASLTGASLIIVTHDKRIKDRFPKQVLL